MLQRGVQTVQLSRFLHLSLGVVSERIAGQAKCSECEWPDQRQPSLAPVFPIRYGAQHGIIAARSTTCGCRRWSAAVRLMSCGTHFSALFDMHSPGHILHPGESIVFKHIMANDLTAWDGPSMPQGQSYKQGGLKYTLVLTSMDHFTLGIPDKPCECIFVQRIKPQVSAETQLL